MSNVHESRPEVTRAEPIFPFHERIADRFAGRDCTLNGIPARICGRLHRFATVATVSGLCSVEFAWPTVERIMERDGQFQA